MDSRASLITGGAGFIGSHLAEALLARGERVTVVDDLSTGTWANVAGLDHNPDFRMLVSSASDEDLMEREIPRHDVVYHLASAVGVRLIIERPVETIERTVNTTEVVLSVCRRYRVPVVITSTSEVYGKSTAVPFKEDDDTVMGPTAKRRWAYAAAKALDEFLALAHYYETSLPVSIVRLFNTVGPRQTGAYGMVLPTFVRQALRNEAITVFGDGTQRRCFCAVEDVVGGLTGIPAEPRTVGTIINLGSQEEISILDLAGRVKSICRSEAPIVHVPYSEAYGEGFDDMPRRVPDISRARDLLGWAPTKSLDEIIEQVADYERGRHPPPD